MNFNRFYVLCAPPSLLQFLPEEAIGLGALSWSSHSLRCLFTEPLGQLVARKFSLCLPSLSEACGVIFVGDVLTYTPLHGDPTSLGYFIKLNSISINWKDMNVPQNGFNVNQSVKLSTMVPYTTL
ncbi:Peptidase A1 domain-containing protein [Psidium guajava]|nr:Peptidase A1 domain-containing protein [Psidium guajava]